MRKLFTLAFAVMMVASVSVLTGCSDSIVGPDTTATLAKDGHNKDGHNKDGHNKDGHNKDGHN